MGTMTGLMLIVLIFVPVVIALMFIPYYTRRTESFGVSIPENSYNRSDLKKMRKNYAMITGIFSVVTLILLLLASSVFGKSEETLSLLLTGMVFVFLAGSFVVYLKFHSKMKQLKEDEQWGVQKPAQVVLNTRFHEEKLIHSNRWFIIPFAISIATALLTLLNYANFPERIPMQYDFDGNVTNWEDKSYRTVLLMPIMQVYLTLLFLFINVVIAKAKQQISAENPEQSLQQNIVFRRRWSAFIILTGTGMTLLFSFVQWSFVKPIDSVLMTVVPIVFGIGVTIGSIILSFSTGQGGSRVKVNSQNGSDVWTRDDDEYWKLGQFYYNKQDPSLFLEKRFGIGWTVNFARPGAWMLLIGIILLAAGIPLLLGI